MEKKSKVKEQVSSMVNDAEIYFERTNTIFGVIAIAYGVGCFSPDATQFYAWFGLVFMAIAWHASFLGLKQSLRILKNIEHPRMSFKYILKRTYVALIGWLFLSCIALGLLTSNGISL